MFKNAKTVHQAENVECKCYSAKMSTCSHSGATTCSSTCETAFLKCVRVQTSEETYSAKQLLREVIRKECIYCNVGIVYRESRSVFYLPNKRKSVATVRKQAAATIAGLLNHHHRHHQPSSINTGKHRSSINQSSIKQPTKSPINQIPSIDPS